MNGVPVELHEGLQEIMDKEKRGKVQVAKLIHTIGRHHEIANTQVERLRDILCNSTVSKDTDAHRRIRAKNSMRVYLLGCSTDDVEHRAETYGLPIEDYDTDETLIDSIVVAMFPDTVSVE